MKRGTDESLSSPPGQGVVGERSTPAIARALSMQARISNMLATGLVGLVAGGLLLWYYTHALTRQTHARQSAQLTANAQASSEMTLPPLGPIEPPALAERAVRVPAAAPSCTASSTVSRASVPARTPTGWGASLLPLSLPPLAAAALQEGNARSLPAGPAAAQAAAPATPLQRRLAGQAFVAATTPASGQTQPAPADLSGSGPGTTTGPTLPGASSGEAAVLLAAQPLTAGTKGALPTRDAAATNPSDAAQNDSIHTSWRAPVSGGTSPYLLPDQSLLLPRGTFIDCTLETAIDSTLPGMTSCITATDTFGADGRVVLMERGTRLVGETDGQVQQGAARVFVLWSEARTPLGVVVPLQSPGADELGRSGLPGTVYRHFWERFGAAIMVSMIDGAVQAAVDSSAQNGGTVVYEPGASQDVMTEVLKSTVNIPPTVVKHNGDRIQVLVARDVDFHDVYELQHAGR